MPEVFPSSATSSRRAPRSIHIDLNAYEIAKNHPVDLGVVADPKLTLAALATRSKRCMTDEQQDAGQGTVDDDAAQARPRSDAADDSKQDEAVRDAVPMHMSRFMEELRAALPADAIIFDEALTNSPPISRYLPPTGPGEYFLTRGGSLGVGIPGAIGVKLANPDKTVIGFTGDGGSMYTIQALWTAARHNIDVEVRRLQQRLVPAAAAEHRPATGRTAASRKHDFPMSFDLSYAADQVRRDGAGAWACRRFASKSRGRSARRSRRCSQHQGPFLIDLVLEGNTHPERVGNTCGQ